VMTSNGLSALVSVGAELLRSIGVPEPAAVLGPLARGSLDNVLLRKGDPAGITGPLVRGETATVERHLEALGQKAPQLVGSYRAVARLILAAASGPGGLDPERAASFERLLEEM
jgi:predicted short-subunit dehydrogenase-like oxidoreductase (DUF2520 family)